jgi:hypothetical protein
MAGITAARIGGTATGALTGKPKSPEHLLPGFFAGRAARGINFGISEIRLTAG